jgi:hypothetical protein
MEKVPKKAAVESVRKVGFLFGLLHYWYTRTLWEEFGKERGTEIVKKALESFGKDRGMRMRKKAEALGYEGSLEKGGPIPFPPEITDLPIPPVAFILRELGKHHCPFGSAWLEKSEEDPEACEIGFLYCKTNDPIKLSTYNPDYVQVGSKIEGLWDTHVCFGDDSCNRSRMHKPTGTITSEYFSHYSKKKQA